MRKVTFTVNGAEKQVVVSEDRVLLDVLREDLALKGTKQSCDRKGQCGACTVIVDNKPVLSCVTKVRNLEGAKVITVEGLGTSENPHLIQHAFCITGAIQCGFCTPGMIMSAKALLDKNLNPTVEDVKKALRRNLCRCTGYKKIVEAVLLAARFLRGETTPDKEILRYEGETLGQSFIRPTAYIKAAGEAEFAGDIKLPDPLELVAVRSTENHALIKSIDYSEAEKMPGVAGVMTAKDIKGTNIIKVMAADQPVLCSDKVHVLGDAVAAVLAETKEQALAAAAMVKVEYEVLPEMREPADAMAEGAVEIHPGTPNLCHTGRQYRGNPEKALEEAEIVVESEFSTPMIHQAPLEPETASAWVEGEGEDKKLVVAGRGINIHQHCMLLQEALGFENVRVEEAYTGGNFGLKLDLTTEPLAAAAALHFNRPVRYVASLEESMKITTKRHPFDMKIRLGGTRDGNINVLDIDYMVNNGAYMSIGIGIVTRALQMLSGSYDIEHVRAEGKLCYTNNGWGGAARGAGPPQVNFALESAIQLFADKAGLDAYEVRRRNVLQPGQATSSGHVQDTWECVGCFDEIKPLYEEAVAAAKAFNDKADGTVRKGVGIAAASFGVGKGGPKDKATARVELNDDGTVTVFGSTADPGEGNDAMITQVAGHILGLAPGQVRYVTRNTDDTPDCGAASGSRITFVPGGAIQDACEQLKAAMDETGAKTASELKAAGKPVSFLGEKKLDTTALDENGQGRPYVGRVHGVQMAEVSVDTETGKVTVDRMTCVVDPGTIINPQVVEGQLEGGLDMGVGMALREEYILGKTKDWVTFKFPRITDMFEMNNILRGTPRANGTLGAVGVGEFVLLPTPACVTNAISFATGGARVRHLPATPEKVKAAIAEVR